MHLLIAAAGSGSRMRANCNKLLLPIAGRPLLAWTLDAVLAAEQISWVGVVGQPIDKQPILSLLESFSKPFVWVDGGSTRQESVQLGLAALPSNAGHVLIHDGARCLVDPELLNLSAKEVLSGNAVIAATPVTDTIKRVDSQGLITDTPNRADLWSAQTPQAFSVEQLRHGHAQALEKGWTVTDDASLYERLGWPVRIIEGAPSNIKVTTPFDLIVAEAVIAMRKGC